MNKSHSNPNPWRGQKVLIVDDSKLVQEQLRQVFQDVGMTVVGAAGNGVIGLEMVRTLQPDLVSLDLIMPEMDGIECYRKLKASFPEVKCMIVSWLAGEPKVLERLAETMPGHIFQPKPVTAQALAARLDKIYDPPSANKSAAESVADMLDVGIKVS